MWHVIFYCFKKNDGANDTADEIYTVHKNYYTTTIMIIRNWFKIDLELAILTWKMKITVAAHHQQILSKPCSLKIRDIMCMRYWMSLIFLKQQYIIIWSGWHMSIVMYNLEFHNYWRRSILWTSLCAIFFSNEKDPFLKRRVTED